jgi:multicomponent Na+:H+ antiporter subunit D
MNWGLFLPLIVPFVAGLLLLAKKESPGWQRGVSLAGSLGMLMASVYLLQGVNQTGVAVSHVGNWPAPFGIVIAADRLSALMVLITAMVGLSCVLFAFFDIEKARVRGSFYALFSFLLFGVNGAFLTGDLFNLFVFYEVVLMASYALTVLGNEKAQVKFGFTYLTINFLGSSLFLVGAGLLFGQLGTLNMAQAAERVANLENKELVTLVAVIFLFVFSLKSAAFPIFNWLPDAYSAPPAPVSAVFAGLLTKVGVYSLYRVFGMIFVHDPSFTHQTILIPLAAGTMLFGVWGAVVQYDIKYILAFHSISQVGYMLMGLALFSPLAMAAGIFHMFHHSLVKSSLFLIGGGIEHRAGSQDLKKLGGLAAQSAFLAVLFMISALALAGIPPLSGFFSKYGLVISGLSANQGWLVLAALTTSLFTLYSMMKIWRLAFWGKSQNREPKDNAGAPTEKTGILTACAVSVVMVLLLTFAADLLMRFSKKAADQILSPQPYIDAVLRGNAPVKGSQP